MAYATPLAIERMNEHSPIDEKMATSFGSATDSYDTGRPSYPDVSVDWMLRAVDHQVVDIADIGAGTGKLTAALISPGRNITAIDPDLQMLNALAAKLASVATAVGTAESIPASNASFDAVILGQAWHWVNPIAASTEIGRVLRPGGVLGLIWNIRDERVGWVAEMGRIIHPSPAEQIINAQGPTVGPPFDAVELHRHDWTRPIDRGTIMAMVKSRSYYITADYSTRTRIDAELSDLLDQLDIGTSTTIDFPHITYSYRAVA